VTDLMGPGPGRTGEPVEEGDGQGDATSPVAPVVDDRPVVLDAAEPAPPDVHPRITVRRSEVRKKLRRRRRRITLALVAVVVLALLAGGVLVSPLTDVDHVDVRGVSELTEAAVAEASGVRSGQAMFSVDAGAVRSAVLDLPWVERARVALRWPSTVEVKVVERPVLAVVVQGERSFLLARGGMVVARNDAALDLDTDATGTGGASEEAAPGAASEPWLPEVALPDGVRPEIGRRLPAQVAKAVEMVAAIPSRLRPWVSKAEVDDAGEVSFVVGIITRVRLGSTDDAAEKFNAVDTMLSGAVVLDCMTELDVRVPTDPRVTRGGRC